MELLQGLFQIWERTNILQRVVFTLILIFLSTWLSSSLFKQRSSNFPFASRNKKDFRSNARRVLIEGAHKFNGPFKVLTDAGPLLILPPEHIDAINATDDLAFNAHINKEFMSHFETFRVMREPPKGMFQEAVIKGITQALPRYTKPLSLEMTAALNDTWGEQKSWKQVTLGPDVSNWIGRISNRIFLGEKIARDEEWNRIMTTYTVKLFTAIGVTKIFHPALRPIVDLLSPLNRKCRRDYARASAILQPVLKARKQEIAAAEEEGRLPQLPDDSIEWFRQASHGRDYQDVDLQFGLAIAAIHTSTDLLSQAILNFCSHPEVQEPLRQETIEVLKTHGLQKVALTELRLLDSFLKETQRLKPINMTSLHRGAVGDVTLPRTDIKIHKGEQTAVSSGRMWDPSVYAEPDTFDAWRFVKRRQVSGLENKSLLVSTSPEHMGFSHGKHACTGRFFAANEVKIALLHVMMTYDMKIERPEDAQWQTYGTAMFARRGAKIWMRKRESEIDLERLATQI